jgi:hypothetical protein
MIGAYIEEGRLLAVFGEEYINMKLMYILFIPFKWILNFDQFLPQ